MTYKLYTGKSSVLKKNTRYVQGGTTEVLPKALGWWEKKQTILKSISDIEFKITSKYHKRPDSVSFLVYDRNDLSWLILQYNNIVDINTEFITGKIIMLPSPLRTFSEILTEPIRYQSQT